MIQGACGMAFASVLVEESRMLASVNEAMTQSPFNESIL
jgi:hypothetical protein